MIELKSLATSQNVHLNLLIRLILIDGKINYLITNH